MSGQGFPDPRVEQVSDRAACVLYGLWLAFDDVCAGQADVLAARVCPGGTRWGRRAHGFPGGTREFVVTLVWFCGVLVILCVTSAVMGRGEFHYGGLE